MHVIAEVDHKKNNTKNTCCGSTRNQERFQTNLIAHVKTKKSHTEGRLRTAAAHCREAQAADETRKATRTNSEITICSDA